MNINDFILDELKKCNYDVPTVRLSYQRVLEEFGIHSTQKSFERQIQRVKKAYLESNPDKLQDSQYVLDNEISSFTPDIKNSDKVTIEEKGNESTVTVNVYNDIKNIDELLTECKVDLEKWIVNSHIVNRWDSSLGGEKVAMYQVKASLSKRIPDQQQIPVLGQVVVNPNNSGQYCLFHTSEGDKVIKKTLIIADAQIGYERNIETGKLKPFHDRKSMDVILKILSKNFFDEIVIDGDMLDFPEASTFAQKPEFAMTMQPALNELSWYFSELRRLAPKAKITYLNGNHECFSDDTEVLTSEGFKKYYDVTGDTLIGTFNEKTEQLEYQKYIEAQIYDYDGEMFSVKNRHNDLLITPNHRFLYKNGTTTSKFIKKPIGEMSLGHNRVIVKASILSTIPENPKYSDDQLSILGWMLTDSSIDKDKKIVFYQREEKVHLITKILDKLKLSYTIKTRIRNISSICGKQLKKESIGKPQCEVYLNIESSEYLLNIFPSLIKVPDFIFSKVSDRQFEVFLNSMIDGDGSRYKTHPKTSLMFYGKQQIVEDLQKACFMHGYRTSIYKYQNKKGTNSKTIQYKLNITKNSYSCFDEFGSYVKKEQYKGKVWDFTVPNDTLIVKRNGRISITGNCRIQKRIVENLSFAYNLKAVGQDFSLFSMQNLLNLSAYDINMIPEYPEGKYWITDDLVIKHGNFTNLNKELSVTMVSVIMGHLHRPETVSKTIHDRNGKKTVTVSCLPALCANTGIVPGSEAGPIWSTGFTYVETNLRNNQSNVHHVITHDGECIFKGNIYSGNDYQFP